MWALLWKDLTIELRTREGVSSLLVLGLLVILVFAFALGPAGLQAEGLDAAFLWVALLFAGMLGIQRSFVLEQERGCLLGLLLCPVDRGTLFLAKVVGNLALLTVLQLALIPMGVAFLGLPPARAFLLLPGALFLGTLGFAALGTLFSAVAVRVRAREVMLPLLLLPLLVPVSLAVVKVSEAVLAGAGWGGVWLRVLLAVDVIYVVAGWLLFEEVVQE